MHFLGIDPSPRGTSVVVSDDSGKVVDVTRIRRPGEHGLALLVGLANDFKSYLSAMPVHVEALTIEDVSMGSLGIVEQDLLQGMFRKSLYEHSAYLFIVSPGKLKSFLGLGRDLSKSAVKAALQRVYAGVAGIDLLKDDGDRDAYLFSRFSCIGVHLLMQAAGRPMAPLFEAPTLSSHQKSLFIGKPEVKRKGRHIGQSVYPGILQRSDFFYHHDGNHPFGWSEVYSV